MMVEISPTLSIPENEFTYIFIRSSGPGGQNVNKVSTSVQLRFDVGNSQFLTDEMKARLFESAGRKINRSGILVIEAKRFRTQEQNRSAAESRLVTLIQNALVKLKKRYPTHPTKASQERRFKQKKLISRIKSLRRSTD
jgi:ribosome-associated protein